MKISSPKSDFQRIEHSVVDALLYGIVEGLAFLGKDSRMIIDDMGNSMLDYLIKIGKVEYNGNPEDFAKSLTEFLVSNGFRESVSLEFNGSPPIPSAPRFVDYLRRTETGTRELQGTASESESGTGEDEREVDWEIVEMITYGMAKGLDSLGVQGQILINRIGWETINYLVDAGKVKRLDDPMEFIHNVGDYFMKVGLAKEVEMTPEGPDIMVFTYTHSRYHMNVLSRLREEGSLLYSCPMCVAGTSIMRMTIGVRVQFDVESTPVRGEKITLRHRMYPVRESFTEEQAREVSRLMDSRT